MIEVKTESGFECKINESALDDLEIVDIFVEVDNGDPSHIGVAVKKLLREDAAKLYDHVRTEDGRVPIVNILNELQDIIGKVKDLKK